VVAVVGLGVNLLSAWLLFDEHHHHGHDHGHGAHGAHHDHDDHHGRDHHDHDDHHDAAHGHDHASASAARHDGQDTNLRAAYLHVLADALTSVLAIAALLSGWAFGWTSLDPLMGIVGALVIAHWSFGLLRIAGSALLDMVPDQRVTGVLRERLEVGGDRVSDLHVWRLGPGHTAVSASIVAADPQPPAVYKERLAGIAGLSHVTIEVHPCLARAGRHSH
jgi:cation diffusion facilitator family transporter